MKVLGVVSARPNFVKMAPVVRALAARGVDAFLAHTGQHFDEEMSGIFFGELGLPAPRVNLGVGALTSWQQSGRVVEGLGDLIHAEKPDWVMVPGDVNGTLAAAVAAVRTGTRLAHLESGLRSFDRKMPEELNRIAVDHLSDRLYVTEPSGSENLKREGVAAERVFFAGNTMIDTLDACRGLAEKRAPFASLGLRDGYILLTMHRPDTVDSELGQRRLLEIVRAASELGDVVFPVHPRTRRRMRELGLEAGFRETPRVFLGEPLGYVDFMAAMLHARVVMTDSGGIQEETTALGLPCLTLRDSTERPVTCSVGTNRLVGTVPENVRKALGEAWSEPPRGARPEGWDGRASERVVQDLLTA